MTITTDPILGNKSLNTKPGLEAATNTVVVIKNILDSFDNVFPNLNKKYSPGLDFLVSLDRMHLHKDRMDSSKVADMPVLLWDRNPILKNDGLLDRGVYCARDSSVTSSPIDVFNVIKGKLVMNFMFVSNIMRDIELFELTYMTHFMPIQEISIDFGSQIGKLNYSLDWKDLNSIQHSVTDYHQIAIDFSVEADGLFILATGDQVKLIYKIILTAYQGVYGSTDPAPLKISSAVITP